MLDAMQASDGIARTQFSLLKQRVSRLFFNPVFLMLHLFHSDENRYGNLGYEGIVLQHSKKREKYIGFFFGL